MSVITKNFILFFSVIGLLSSYQVSYANETKRDSSQDNKFIMHGAVKFAENCAECHGKIAQGTPNWHEPDAKGNYPPPPLDGTGHAWHHSEAVLKHTIRDGGKKLGGTMPGFDKKLNDRDMEAIIVWLQSHWPDKILKTWKSNYLK